MHGKIIIPATNNDIMREIIAIAHQADHKHRTQKETVKEFTSTFTLDNTNAKDTKKFVIAICRHCLACIKTRKGGFIPTPHWYMVRATKPFELIHADYVDMPEDTEGNKYALVIVDDLSLTGLIQPCKRNTAEVMATALLEHWLAHYPDPLMIHTDGGTHFNNKLIKAIAQARGWELSISTPYAKWAHGIAERMNKAFLQIMRTLCSRPQGRNK
jgi:hypothetical protein